MVPGTEHGLEKDRKDAEKRGSPTRSPPSAADPNPCGQAQRHVDFASPQYHAPSLALSNYVMRMLSYNGRSPDIRSLTGITGFPWSLWLPRNEICAGLLQVGSWSRCRQERSQGGCACSRRRVGRAAPNARDARDSSARPFRRLSRSDSAATRPATARLDLAVIFDLASHLGLGANFFAGDLEAAWRHQLEPSGLTLAQLRANPVGMKVDLATHYRKYAGLDPSTGKPRGFPTPSRKLEVYSARFAGAGYDPLPCHNEPAESPLGTRELAHDYPFVLTSFRLLQFVDQQHRNIPRLRNEVHEPFVEIHPETASGLRVLDGE
jgi:hypothetical protein